LVDYRAQTLERRECITQRNAVVKADAANDKLTLKRMICTVDTDWVDAIEAGLIHIEKAIKEERQFIRSNGEVIPIEKVKHVSKDSVEHLAKHSNLITRQTEGEDIIPDQLYTVERLSDFAVYENRFLYMLLCYLKDFITLRYNKILESSNTYDGNMTMSKKIKVNKRTICYDVSLKEERKDDEYLSEHNEAKEIIDRISILLKAVIAFLSTPLMEQVAKAPMLKPPITKTNVLKMNNNFKGAMALYEYVTSYTKPGYTIEVKVTDISPFREQAADELAETVLLSSFLTYEYNLDLKNTLQASYEEEEKRRKEEEYKKFLEKLEMIRRRVQKSGQSPEEYILMLEKQIRILENKCAKLDAALEEIDRLRASLAEAREEIASLRAQLEATREELAYQKQKYIDDMAALKAEYEEEIRRINEEHQAQIDALNEEIRRIIAEYEENIRILNEQHQAEIQRLNEEHQAEIERYEQYISELKETHAEEIRQLNEAHEQRINELLAAHADEISRLEQQHKEEIEQIRAEHNLEIQELKIIIENQRNKIEEERQQHAKEKLLIEEMHKQALAAQKEQHDAAVGQVVAQSDRQRAEIDKLIAERDELIKEKRLMTAQLYALRVEKGVNVSENDFTLKDNFDELEHEFEVFKKFYREEWNKTKRAIRHSVLKSDGKNESKSDGGKE
jgi:hypothetical protein